MAGPTTNSWYSNIPVQISLGGTNTTTFTNTDGVVYFDGTKLTTTTVGTVGQVLTSNGAGVAPTFQSGGGGGGITTIDGDTGSVTGSTVAFNAALTAGSSVSFSGSGTTMSFNVTDSNNNTTIGLSTGTPGSNNTVLGSSAGGGGSDNAVLGSGACAGGGNNNTMIGYLCGNGNTNRNIFIGQQAGVGFVNDDNIIIGYQAGLGSVDGGSFNVIAGSAAGNIAAGCSYNILIGLDTGNSYLAGGESSNICIGANVVGLIGESNTCRIGAGTGAGNGQLLTTFISGINGVDNGVATVVTESSDKLGTATITGSTGIAISTGTNAINIATNGTQTWNYHGVTGASPYVVGSTDTFIGVPTNLVTYTIQLPNAPATGRVYVVKDSNGHAATRNITVTTVGGAINIDGATTLVMNTNFQSTRVLFNGTQYLIF